MHVRVTSDANQESGVGVLVLEISGPTRKEFLHRTYGSGLSGLVVVLMCRDPDLNFKRRIRFSKKEKKLYMDVMLDLSQMMRADHAVRKRIITDQLATEVPAILRKYAFDDFDEARFVDDWKNWLREITTPEIQSGSV
jgi:hypothetical protein